jgi:hypothetical protein
MREVRAARTLTWERAEDLPDFPAPSSRLWNEALGGRCTRRKTDWERNVIVVLANS